MGFCPDYKLEILPEEGFDIHMDALEERLEACRKEGYFQGVKDLKIYYEYFLAENARGAVVIVHGLSEFTQKYHEFAGYLLNQGYHVFLYDQRGHGRSGRQTDRLDLIHVDQFTDYAKDLELFLQTVVRPATELPLYLYAHSMGGAVSALYLAKHPDTFVKAVMSAPMIMPIFGDVPLFFAQMGLGMYLLISNRKAPFWGTKEFDPNFKFENSHDKSRARFDRNMRLRLANPCYCTTPISMQWAYKSLFLGGKFTSKGFIRKLRTPILMLSGDHDTVVNTDYQAKFAEKYHLCRRVVMAGATHSMLLGEQQTIYDHVKQVLDHFG